MPGTWHSNGAVNMYVDGGTTRKTDTVVTGSERMPVLPTTATLAEPRFLACRALPGSAWQRRRVREAIVKRRE